MHPECPIDDVVWNSKWFQIIARRAPGHEEPHYSLRTRDYVSVVATDPQGHLLLVRQFRPAVWNMTLEIPSGHVEEGQSPEQAAKMELIEETGHEAEHFEFLCQLSPDTGRLGNRMWCFFAGNAVMTQKEDYQPEPGLEFMRYDGTLRSLLQKPEFDSALNRAALFAAVLHGKIFL